MSTSRTAAAVRSSEVRAPRAIRTETPQYVLRTLEPSDVTDRACAWFGDATKTAMINLSPRAYSQREFADYILSHDRISGHILGIFDKASGQFIGFWSVYIDWDHREFLVNVLVGERGYSHAKHETQRQITTIFFDEFDLLTMRFAVLAKNQRLDGRVGAAGMAVEHTTHKPSVSTEAFEEVHHYSLDREAWRKYRDGRALRDTVSALTEAALAGI